MKTDPEGSEHLYTFNLDSRIKDDDFYYLQAPLMPLKLLSQKQALNAHRLQWQNILEKSLSFFQSDSKNSNIHLFHPTGAVPPNSHPQN